MHKSILVLEESRMVHELFDSALPDDFIRWEVVHESKPDNYIQIANETNPDIIFLSNQDQKRDYATVKKLKSSPSSADTPILLLTSAKDKLDEALLQTIGVRGFVRKPFETSTLQKQLNQVLREQENQIKEKSSDRLKDLNVVDDDLMELLSGHKSPDVSIDELEGELDPTLQLMPEDGQEDEEDNETELLAMDDEDGLEQAEFIEEDEDDIDVEYDLDDDLDVEDTDIELGELDDDSDFVDLDTDSVSLTGPIAAGQPVKTIEVIEPQGIAGNAPLQNIPENNNELGLMELHVVPLRSEGIRSHVVESITDDFDDEDFVKQHSPAELESEYMTMDQNDDFDLMTDESGEIEIPHEEIVEDFHEIEEEEEVEEGLLELSIEGLDVDDTGMEDEAIVAFEEDDDMDDVVEEVSIEDPDLQSPPEDIEMVLQDETDEEGTQFSATLEQDEEGIDVEIDFQADEPSGILDDSEPEQLFGGLDSEEIDEEGLSESELEKKRSDQLDIDLEEIAAAGTEEASATIQEMIGFRQVMKAKYDLPDDDLGIEEETDDDAFMDEDAGLEENDDIVDEIDDNEDLFAEVEKDIDEDQDEIGSLEEDLEPSDDFLEGEPEELLMEADDDDSESDDMELLTDDEIDSDDMELLPDDVEEEESTDSSMDLLTEEVEAEDDEDLGDIDLLAEDEENESHQMLLDEEPAPLGLEVPDEDSEADDLFQAAEEDVFEDGDGVFEEGESEDDLFSVPDADMDDEPLSAMEIPEEEDELLPLDEDIEDDSFEEIKLEQDEADTFASEEEDFFDVQEDIEDGTDALVIDDEDMEDAAILDSPEDPLAMEQDLSGEDSADLADDSMEDIDFLPLDDEPDENAIELDLDLAEDDSDEAEEMELEPPMEMDEEETDPFLDEPSTEEVDLLVEADQSDSSDINDEIEDIDFLPVDEEDVETTADDSDELPTLAAESLEEPDDSSTIDDLDPFDEDPPFDSDEDTLLAMDEPDDLSEPTEGFFDETDEESTIDDVEPFDESLDLGSDDALDDTELGPVDDMDLLSDEDDDEDIDLLAEVEDEEDDEPDPFADIDSEESEEPSLESLENADEVTIQVPHDTFEMGDFNVNDITGGEESEDDEAVVAIQEDESTPDLMEGIKTVRAEEESIDSQDSDANESYDNIDLPAMDEDLPDLPPIMDKEESGDDENTDFEAQIDEKSDITFMQSENDFEEFDGENEIIGVVDNNQSDVGQATKSDSIKNELQSKIAAASLPPEFRQKLSDMVSETVHKTLQEKLPEMVEKLMKDEMDK